MTFAVKDSILLLVFMLIAPAGIAASDAPFDFDHRLNEIKRARSGRSTDYTIPETSAERLLEENLSPSQRGLVHYEVAHIYAQTGHQNPERLQFHIAQALKYPLDLELQLRLHMYAGDSLGINEQLTPDEQRKQAMEAYLTGMKAGSVLELKPGNVLEFSITEPELPKLLNTISSSSSQTDEERANRIKIMEEYEEAKIQHELLFLVKVLEWQIAGLHKRKPYDLEGLKARLAAHGDPEATQRIVTHVEQHMAEHPMASPDLPFPNAPQETPSSFPRRLIVILNLVALMVFIVLYIIKRTGKKKNNETKATES